ncbi:hypothetical protein BKI52_39580 [marine bacterium AO1-C]|nr:hypothetical protein BKI52_39580 [marine bacterium AO1-C]
MLYKLKYKIKGIFGQYQFFKALPHFKQASGQLILAYHGIDQYNSTHWNTKFLGYKQFDKQMALLKKHFEVVDLATFCQKEKSPQKLQITITFDDGFENNYTYAKPILEKYQIPATFFIATPQLHGYDVLWADLLDLGTVEAPSQVSIGDYLFIKKNSQFYNQQLGSLKQACTQQNGEFIQEVYKAFGSCVKFKNKQKLKDYWQLMNDKQLQDLASNPLFTIGAHGVLHTSIHLLTQEEALQEMKKSKHRLEDITQKSITDFAYPHGWANNTSIEWGRMVGFKRQFLANETDIDLQHHEEIYNRMGNNPFVSPKAQVYYAYKGGY